DRGYTLDRPGPLVVPPANRVRRCMLTRKAIVLRAHPLDESGISTGLRSTVIRQEGSKGENKSYSTTSPKSIRSLPQLTTSEIFSRWQGGKCHMWQHRAPRA